MSFRTPDQLAAEADALWAELQPQIAECPLKNKQRLQIPLQEMPAQHPQERRGNMDEVTFGYTESQARVEAERCLQCPTAPCVAGCPVAIDIPGFIKNISNGDYAGSLAVIRETSLLPSICGRVCPQEAQCQLHCTVGKAKKDVFQSVSIGRLERFVADWGSRNRQSIQVESDETAPGPGPADTGSTTRSAMGPAAATAAVAPATAAPGAADTTADTPAPAAPNAVSATAAPGAADTTADTPAPNAPNAVSATAAPGTADTTADTPAPDAPAVKPETGRKVAVIGSGPAAITAAADIRREGHTVTMFEAFHKPGGVLVYGIPEFRLPKRIVEEEIATLEAMGVEIRTNFLVGRTRTLRDLKEKDGYEAIFIGSGAGLPKFMHIEGENLVGVFAANEYLTRSNLMKAYDRERADTPIFSPRNVAVLGGGNVAMDAARTAVRLGAEEVNVIYRRTRTEMPARAEEVDHAEEEGVVFHFLRNPARILGDENEHVRALEVLKYELGEPDDSGRRRPIAIPGSEYEIPVDTVIVSIGNDSNPLLTSTTPELETNKWGNIVADDNGRTSMDGVWAGGDIVLGAATVILAMGQGRTAAEAINAHLAGTASASAPSEASSSTVPASTPSSTTSPTTARRDQRSTVGPD